MYIYIYRESIHVYLSRQMEQLNMKSVLQVHIHADARKHRYTQIPHTGSQSRPPPAAVLPDGEPCGNVSCAEVSRGWEIGDVAI